MSPSQPSKEQPVGSRQPHTRSESRRAHEANSTDFEFFECIQKEAEEELRTILDL